jgi:hypothetical protein
VFDPALDNALLDRGQQTTRTREGGIRDGRAYAWPLLPNEAAPTNLQVAIDEAASRPSLTFVTSGNDDAASAPVVRMANGRSSNHGALFHFRINPGARYLLTYRSALDNAAGVVSILGTGFQRNAIVSPCPTVTDLTTDNTRGVWNELCANAPRSITTLQYVSLWTTSSAALDLELDADLHCFDTRVVGCFATLDQFHLQTYDPSTLPIELDSLFPYRAKVTFTPDQYLETTRIYIGGYTARVNGTVVEPVRSARGRVLIPLVGSSPATVELDYVGTPWMKFASMLSIVAWLFVGGFVLLRRMTSAPMLP